MVTTTQKSQHIQVLDRALHVMDSLIQLKKPLGVNELARANSITPSACFRILKTLEENGWVFQCEDDKYILGQKIGFVTGKENLFIALREVAYHVMKRLSEREDHPMNLVVRQDNRNYVLQQTHSNRFMDFVPPIGTNLPLHASAGSKILLCELPAVLQRTAVDSITFERLTSNTICQKSDFMEELNKVRRQQYALDFCESIETVCCIGVPVRNNKGEIIAALSFSGIMNVKAPEQLLYYLPMLKNAAKEISDRLYTLQEEYKQMDAEASFDL